jgi:hypothetical protein
LSAAAIAETKGEFLLLVAFKARAEARALLFHVGEFDLHDAVDQLQVDAETSGLVAEIGQDAVQAIMALAFGEARNAGA